MPRGRACGEKDAGFFRTQQQQSSSTCSIHSSPGIDTHLSSPSLPHLTLSPLLPLLAAMTGLGTGLVISLSAFLLGVLSMHWTADHLLLWQSPITHQSLVSAHAYYSHTYGINSGSFLPSSIRAGQGSAEVKEQGLVLHLAWALGCLLVLSKIFFGRRQSNWLFDGASLCEFSREASW